MGKVDVLKETTPLSSEDCFLVMQRPKSGFNFPLHVHMEFELNYLENAAGSLRDLTQHLTTRADDNRAPPVFWLPKKRNYL